jgi:hypothetical protein
MSSIDLIKEWGAEHVVDAMRDDEWFALAVFSAVANATDVASKAAAFGNVAQKNGCIVVETEGLAERLRRLADVFDSTQDKTP